MYQRQLNEAWDRLEARRPPPGELSKLINKPYYQTSRQLEEQKRRLALLAAIENQTTPPTEMPMLVISGIVKSLKPADYGKIIRANTIVWAEVCRQLVDDWTKAYEIPAEKWEEIVAGAFDIAGFDEVILTPRSRDHGRDIIALKHGLGSIKIIGSVKAYKPSHNVAYDDVRSLLGVLSGERDASKGMIITTSDFPPRILEDPFIAPFTPTRLELINGKQLNQWLGTLL